MRAICTILQVVHRLIAICNDIADISMCMQKMSDITAVIVREISSRFIVVLALFVQSKIEISHGTIIPRKFTELSGSRWNWVGLSGTNSQLWKRKVSFLPTVFPLPSAYFLQTMQENSLFRHHRWGNDNHAVDQILHNSP